MTLGASSFEGGGSAQTDTSDDSADLVAESSKGKASSDDSDDLFE